MTAQCSHMSPRGTRCRLSASDGATCKRHSPSYARKPLAAKRVVEAATAAAVFVGPTADTRVLSERGVDLHHCDWRELAEVARAAGGVDALIVDAPYSERTHAGHDDGVNDLRLAGEEKRSRVDRRNGAVYSVGVNRRRQIDYPAWDDDDVIDFVAAWTPLVRGWMVTITDHALAIQWSRSLAAHGRYVFAPLPLYSPGSRVRLSGDGPSSWTCWIVVSRPATREFFRWGTLPGGYVAAPESMTVVGGKPLSAMRDLVRDYTRPDDLVCDPCCGAGTLGVAAIAEGRRALLGDRDAAHVRIAAERIRALPVEPRKGTLALPWGAA